MREMLYKLLDQASTLSSNRFAFIFTVIISNFAFWLTWAFVSSDKGALADVPAGVYITYGLANGIVSAAKITQNITENKKPGESGPPSAGGGIVS